MSIDFILKTVLAAAVVLAVATNIVLYIALRSRGVEASLMRSAKPGYLENLYRQTPALRCALLDATAFFCTLSKILFIVAAIVLVLSSSIKR